MDQLLSLAEREHGKISSTSLQIFHIKAYSGDTGLPRDKL
jgi:hypothetical protein